MPPRSRFRSLPPSLAEDFQVLVVLGEGASSTVVRGVQRSLRRPVVLKLLHLDLQEDGDFLARFRQEARLLSRLEHPHLLSLLDFGCEGDLAYMVYPDDQGTSLDLILRRRGHLPPGDGRRLALHMLEALGHLHDAGVIHRDVKPGNILQVPGGDWRLFDLGLARSSEPEGIRTRTGQILGTPLYMSPQQAEARPPEPRDDLYSLGVVLYEALSGSHPFAAGSLGEILRLHANHRPPPLTESLPQVSRRLARLVELLLEKDPERRPPDAADCRARLLARRVRPRPAPGDAPARAPAGSPPEDARAEGAPTEGPASSGTPRKTPSREDRGKGRLGAGILLLGLVLALGLAWSRVPDPRLPPALPPRPGPPAPSGSPSPRPLLRELEATLDRLPRDLARWGEAPGLLPELDRTMRNLASGQQASPERIREWTELGRQLRAAGYPSPLQSWLGPRPATLPVDLDLEDSFPRTPDAPPHPAIHTRGLQGWTGTQARLLTEGVAASRRISRDLYLIARDEPPSRPMPEILLQRWRLAGVYMTSGRMDKLKSCLGYLWEGGPNHREALQDWLGDEFQLGADFLLVSRRALAERRDPVPLELYVLGYDHLRALGISPHTLQPPEWKLGGSPRTPEDFLLAGLSERDAMSLRGNLGRVPEDEVRRTLSLLERALVPQRESPRAATLARVVYRVAAWVCNTHDMPGTFLSMLERHRSLLASLPPEAREELWRRVDPELSETLERRRLRGEDVKPLRARRRALEELLSPRLPSPRPR